MSPHLPRLLRHVTAFRVGLVALVLLFGQGVGAAHALTHLGDPLRAPAGSHDKSLPDSPVCDLCVLAAGVASAALPSSAPSLGVEADHVLTGRVELPRPSLAPLRPRSRAPPLV